jgi:hypothetical protein
MKVGDFFSTNLVFGLNPFGAFLQNSQKKNRKEKEKRKGKREKGRGKRFGLEPETAHDPTNPIPNRYTSPSLTPADRWDPPIGIVSHLASVTPEITAAVTPSLS